MITTEQRACIWLQQQGIHKPQLTPLAGYTNHVFLVESRELPCSVLRMANTELASGFCPLATDTAAVIQKHKWAVELGLAPPLLGQDLSAKIMWVAYAGAAKPIETADLSAIGALLSRLHDSGICLSEQPLPLMQWLRDLCRNTADDIQIISYFLLQRAEQVGYADWSMVPIHSDLNPANCLYDGQRWWLIDWDYAAQSVAAWDYASLLVENGWDYVPAEQLVPTLAKADLAWFCCCFALLSWQWHSGRGSTPEIITEKWQQVRYWRGLLA